MRASIAKTGSAFSRCGCSRLVVRLNLENRKDLRRRYNSLYRTLLNWYQKNDKDA